MKLNSPSAASLTVISKHLQRKTSNIGGPARYELPPPWWRPIVALQLSPNLGQGFKTFRQPYLVKTPGRGALPGAPASLPAQWLAAASRPLLSSPNRMYSASVSRPHPETAGMAARREAQLGRGLIYILSAVLDRRWSLTPAVMSGLFSSWQSPSVDGPLRRWSSWTRMLTR